MAEIGGDLRRTALQDHAGSTQLVVFHTLVKFHWLSPSVLGDCFWATSFLFGFFMWGPCLLQSPHRVRRKLGASLADVFPGPTRSGLTVGPGECSGPGVGFPTTVRSNSLPPA